MMFQEIEKIKTARLLPYDTNKFRFAFILEKTVFKVPKLDLLHEYWSKQKEKKGLSALLSYEDNLFLRSLMQKQPDDSPFYKLYHSFIRYVVAPEFGGKISYSNHPKMRVHLAGTPSVSAWHKDVDVTKRTDQMNVWLPFTNCYETNSLWIETDYGKKDYCPVNVPYGYALFFDGGYLEHGTVANLTPNTRVSLDFRFSVIAQK